MRSGMPATRLALGWRSRLAYPQRLAEMRRRDIRKPRDGTLDGRTSAIEEAARNGVITEAKAMRTTARDFT